MSTNQRLKLFSVYQSELSIYQMSDQCLQTLETPLETAVVQHEMKTRENLGETVDDLTMISELVDGLLVM